MKQSIKHQPIILLVNQCSKENDSIKILLESKNYSTRKATSVFDALDEISDFTLDCCPDVFMLPVSSPAGDFATIEELVVTYSENGKILVATFSGADDEKGGNFFSRQFSRVETSVSALPPPLKNAASANNSF